MTRDELRHRSEAYIRSLLADLAPGPAAVYLYGSRARGSHAWNADYDLWIDAPVTRAQLGELQDKLEESFVPFKVDLVTTAQLNGRFGDQVRKDAVRWM